MKADLYLCSTTFSYNLSDSIDELKKKLSDFHLMIEKIREYNYENTLYMNHKDFTSIIIYNDGKSIYELISQYEFTVSKYGKDIITIFISLYIFVFSPRNTKPSSFFQ